jgi:hypothetical protein
MEIIAGRLSTFVIFITMLILIFIPLFLTQRRKIKPQEKLQRLAALDAIDENLARAAEMGRPIMFGLGAYANLKDDSSTQTMAGLDILSYVAREAAKADTPLFCSTGKSESLAAMTDIVEEAYRAEGKADHFDAKRCVWWSDAWTQYYIGLTGLLYDTKPATVIFSGAVSWEAAQLSTEIHDLGGVLIGGTGRYGASNQSLMAIGSDYHIILEEMYAASAYLSRDPIECATILGQDYSKFLEIGLIILGVILLLAGVKIFANFLQM